MTNYQDLMSKWSAIKFEEINYNGRTVCEIEGCDRPGTDGHHCLIGTDKRFKKWLDDVRNMQIVCREDHLSGRADTPENKETALRNAIERHGKQAIIDWLDEAPEKKNTDEMRHKLESYQKE